MNLRQFRVIIASSALLLSPFIQDVAQGDEPETPVAEGRLVRKAVSEQPVRANTKVPPADSDKVEREQQAPQPQAVKPPSSSLRKGLAPNTPAAEPEEECGEITVPIPDMKVFPLNNHLFADSKIGDNEERRLEVRVYLKQTPMRIWLTVEVQVQEWRSGVDTHYLGTGSAIVYDARQENYGCQIASVLNERVESTLSVWGGPAVYGGGEEVWAYMGRDTVVETQYGWTRAMDIKNDLHSFSYSSNNKNLISGGSCVVNANGDDKDKLGCTNIKFNPLLLKLKKNDPQVCASFRLVEHPPIWLKPLKHYKGDSDIKGNERDVWIADSRQGRKSPYLRVLNGERVQVVGNLGIRERFSDHSSFESNFSFDIASKWDVPPQCKIVSAQIDSQHLNESQLVNAVKDHNYHAYDGVGLFRKAICRTDTGTRDGMTSDEGGVGCKVYPRNIMINLAHVGPDD